MALLICFQISRLLPLLEILNFKSRQRTLEASEKSCNHNRNAKVQLPLANMKDGQKGVDRNLLSASDMAHEQERKHLPV